MHIRSETDPAYIAAMVDAANDLAIKTPNIFQRNEWNIGINKIVTLRAAAHGYREFKTFYENYRYGGLPAIARGAAGKAAKLAGMIDKHADRLCRFFDIPYEFRGMDQLLTRVFWHAYRDIRIEVQDYKYAWVLIAMGCASDDARRQTIAHDNDLPHHFREHIDLLGYAKDAAFAFSALAHTFREARLDALPPN